MGARAVASPQNQCTRKSSGIDIRHLAGGPAELRAQLGRTLYLRHAAEAEDPPGDLRGIVNGGGADQRAVRLLLHRVELALAVFVDHAGHGRLKADLDRDLVVAAPRGLPGFGETFIRRETAREAEPVV